MIKFVLIDPATGEVLARCLADAKSFETWPGEKLVVDDETFADRPEMNYHIDRGADVGAIHESPSLVRKQTKEQKK